jgi:hypothetical protein
LALAPSPAQGDDEIERSKAPAASLSDEARAVAVDIAAILLGAAVQRLANRGNRATEAGGGVRQSIAASPGTLSAPKEPGAMD